MKYRIEFHNGDVVEVQLNEYISKVENEKRAIILAQAEQIKNNKFYVTVKHVTITEHIMRNVNFDEGEGYLNLYVNCKKIVQAGGIYKSKQIAADVAKHHCKGSVFISWKNLL